MISTNKDSAIRNSLKFGGKFGLIRCGFSVSLCEFVSHTFATLMWRGGCLADSWRGYGVSCGVVRIAHIRYAHVAGRMFGG